MEREHKEQKVVLNYRNIAANDYIKYRFNTLGHYRDMDDAKNY